MSERTENALLLNKHLTSDSKTYRGDGGSSSGEDSCQSEEWWCGSASRSSSSCSSCCSDSQSDTGSVAEWEAEVDDQGNLFYIRSPPKSEIQKLLQPVVEENISHVSNSETESRPSRRGKLAGLIRRRNSKRYRHKGNTVSSSEAASKPTNEEQTESFSASSRLQSNSSVPSPLPHIQESEYTYEVSLHLDPAARYNLGRRASLAESLLGLAVSGVDNESSVQVIGFIPNGEAIRLNGIRVGDRLRFINNQEVSTQNLDGILSSFSSPCKVQLKLQRAPVGETSKLIIGGKTFQAPRNTKEHSETVRKLVNVPVTEELYTTLQSLCVGVVYLTQEGLSADEVADDQSLLYCFPPSTSHCPLTAVRGALLTLHLLLPQLAPSSPKSSTLMLRGELIHILYWPYGNDLLLLAIPGSRCSIQEGSKLITDVVCHLQFYYQTLTRAFTSSEFRPEIDRFFAVFFSRLISRDHSVYQFEEIMPAVHWMPLPNNAQVRLNCALSELESNDFEELGCNIDDCQRLFTIVGCSFYHKGCLLASHLPTTDLPDVHSTLRQLGLIALLQVESVQLVIFWHEVFPSSCSRRLSSRNETLNSYNSPEGRWFLLVVGREWDLLAVLLESAGCTVKASNNPGPDVCFVEEALDTVSYIQSIGISAIASKWMLSPPRPQVTSPEAINANRTVRQQDHFLGFIRPNDSKSSPPSLASSSLLSLNSSNNRRAGDAGSANTSTLARHRGSLDLLHTGQSAGSEDSASQACSSSVLSECSDEAVGGCNTSGAGGSVGPVVGRRAERELRAGAGSRSSGGSGTMPGPRSDASDSDDSDWEAYQAFNRRGYNGSSSEMSETTLSLLADVDDVLPLKLTAGEDNALFHYVHLDVYEGVLLAPPNRREKLSGASQLREILAAFRECCHNIHVLLQNTVCFKKMMGQEVTKTISRSLVAIKEHGVLFEISADSEKKGARSLTFWVVGRLFFSPQPREVYVCYLDTAPQNMIEIAFRLGLSACG